MAQTLVHGARVLEVDGNFDACLEVARVLAERYPVTLVNSVNPYRLEGQKTLAFEVCDALGRAPDLHFVPVGNAGNISSHWMGYSEYAKDGVIDRAAGPARVPGRRARRPIVRGEPIANPSTIATAIRIGNPASWGQAVDAAKDSGGEILAVTDREILSAVPPGRPGGRLLRDGVSAASVAGLLQAASGRDGCRRARLIVCVLTGHGLKDPDWAIAGAGKPPVLPPDADAIAADLGL